jgi:hypothetical protein
MPRALDTHGAEIQSDVALTRRNKARTHTEAATDVDHKRSGVKKLFADACKSLEPPEVPRIDLVLGDVVFGKEVVVEWLRLGEPRAPMLRHSEEHEVNNVQ